MIERNRKWTVHRAALRSVVVCCVIGFTVVFDSFAYGQATRPQSLHEAVSAGEVARVKELLDRGADIDRPWRSRGNVSLLMLAIRGGHGELVDLLIERGADILYASPTGQTALHYAAELGDVGLCERLLDKGADVRAKADRGRTPLHLAAYRGRADVCRLLAARGARLNLRDHTQQAALHFALGLRKLDTAEALIDLGSSVNLRDWEGVLPLARLAEKGDLRLVRKTLLKISKSKTGDRLGAMNEALHRAYLSQFPKVAVFLIESGANPEMTLDSGLRLIHLACELGSEPLLELSLAHYADPNASVSPSGWTPIHFAVVRSQPEIIGLLHATGANLDLVDGEGRSPLHLACLKKVLPSARQLLERGVDIDLQDALGNTALHYAVISQRRVMVEMLIRRDADVTLKNVAGQTAFDVAGQYENARILSLVQGALSVPEPWKPSTDERRVMDALVEGPEVRVVAERLLISGYPLLHVAVMHGDAAMVRLVLESDDDVGGRDPYGFHALHRAAERGDAEMVSILIEHGASPSDRENVAGWSPLHFSASGGHGGVTHRLVVAGADVIAEDGAGRSPLDVAVLSGDESVISMLSN